MRHCFCGSWRCGQHWAVLSLCVSACISSCVSSFVSSYHFLFLFTCFCMYWYLVSPRVVAVSLRRKKNSRSPTHVASFIHCLDLRSMPAANALSTNKFGQTRLKRFFSSFKFQHFDTVSKHFYGSKVNHSVLAQSLGTAYRIFLKRCPGLVLMIEKGRKEGNAMQCHECMSCVLCMSMCMSLPSLLISF